MIQVEQYNTVPGKENGYDILGVASFEIGFRFVIQVSIQNIISDVEKE